MQSVSTVGKRLLLRTLPAQWTRQTLPMLSEVKLIRGSLTTQKQEERGFSTMIRLQRRPVEKETKVRLEIHFSRVVSQQRLTMLDPQLWKSQEATQTLNASSVLKKRKKKMNKHKLRKRRKKLRLKNN